MCLSIPGKVIKIEPGKITVDYVQETREIQLALVPINVGDYVIVSNKMIIAKLKEEEAKKALELVQ
jgi:hydrogenase assembly chaperone HypC/HupF